MYINSDAIIFFTSFLIGFYLYSKKIYNHFKDTDIQYIKPSLPFLGNTLAVLLQREHFIDFIQKLYKKFPNDKYIGFYQNWKPFIYIRDIELIKEVGIKHFEQFPNHANIINEDVDQLLGKSLVALEGDKWKDMRSTLSPAFTSSKMRNMFVFINDAAKEFTEYYIEKSKNIENGTIKIETKDAFTRYTNDVIADSAFGLKVNSLKDKRNEFYEYSKIATNFSGLQIIKFICYTLFPTIMKILKIEFVNKKAKLFFQALIKNTMQYREKNSIVRNDMIHLLMEAKKGTLVHETSNDSSEVAGFATVQESTIGKLKVARKWDDDDIIAQAFIFLTGGFETTSTFITFFFYEMMINPDVQKKLQDEIDNYKLENKEEITYNDLQKLKYLDCCVCESLRMWPPGLVTDRVCIKPFTLPPPNELSTKSYTTNVGQSVWVPIYALHHDPKYFPSPEKFDPERFSDENKDSVETGAYLPFGFGPRNCIGSRYALMVGKLIIIHILANFDIVSTENSQIPIILDKSSFNLLPKNGMHIGLKIRSKKKEEVL